MFWEIVCNVIALYVYSSNGFRRNMCVCVYLNLHLVVAIFKPTFYDIGWKKFIAGKMIGMWMHVDDERDRYQCLVNAKFFMLYKVMVINMSLPMAHDKN